MVVVNGWRPRHRRLTDDPDLIVCIDADDGVAMLPLSEYMLLIDEIERLERENHRLLRLLRAEQPNQTEATMNAP